MPTDANEVLESSPETEQEIAVDLESLSEEQYNSWRMDGKLPEAKPAEPPPAKETDATPAEAGKSKGTQEIGKGKGVKARTEQLDIEIQELEARLARKADLKRQLDSETGDKKTDPPPAEAKPAELKAPTKPKSEDFKTWEEYETAKDKFFEDLSDYKVQKTIQEDRVQRAEEATQRERQAEARRAADTWNKQVDGAAKAHPDWNDVIGPVAEMIKEPRFAHGADFLIDSELGAEILYQLGSDPDRIKEIVTMKPTAQVAALTRIEVSLKKAAEPAKAVPGPKKHTETPPPPTELAGRNQLNPDPVKAALEVDDTEAYIAAANAKDAADIAAGKRKRF